MKNIILILTLIFSFGMYAQVGINETDPKATLDVSDSNDDTSPDGILVPRLTRSELGIKAFNNAYGSDQDGALIFVNDVTGSTTSQTANIDAVGFYSFDASAGSNGEWIKVGGGSAGGPDFTPKGITTGAGTDDYSGLTNNVIVINSNTGGPGTDVFGGLPDPVANAGRIILIRNEGTKPTGLSVFESVTPDRSGFLVSDGQEWSLFGN